MAVQYSPLLMLFEYFLLSGVTSLRNDRLVSASEILDQVTSKDIYDRRLRPNYGGEPVDVAVTLHVTKISSISELDMDYTLDFDIKQMWKDPRLAWKHDIFNKSIRVQDVDFVNNIWIPDTFFPNEKRAKLHNSPVNSSFTILRTNGRITTFQRITITAACPMNLHLFPFDTQLCTLEVESYGYSTEDIKLHWHDDGHSPVKIDEHLRLPTFTMDDMIVEETDQILSTGNYSRLSCKFKFIRSIRYYYLQIYQPSVFVVATSWVPFWIDRESAPARVTLCITAILTMTTLTSLTSEQMPKVGYAKAVDIYLVVCYFMVFGALMEYALISYLIVGEKATKQKRRISPLPQKVDYVVAGIYCSSQDSSDRAANNLTKRKITVTV